MKKKYVFNNYFSFQLLSRACESIDIVLLT